MRLHEGRLRRRAVALAVATLLGLAVAAPASAAPGDIIWIDRYSNSFFSFAHRIMVRTDGRTFVTGQGTDRDYVYDYLTIAYSPQGQRLWSRTYDGQSGSDVANDMAFGPNENRIYVTGRSTGIATGRDSAGDDWATVAYRANGTRLWARRYNGPSSHDDRAEAVEVSAQSGRIFVAGSSTGKATHEDMTTIAYSPSGERLWSRRYDGAVSGSDGATQLLVGPSGHRIYVTGTSTTGAGTQEITVIAYRSDGARIWTRRINSDGGEETVASTALGPDGRSIYLTGSSAGDLTTTAFRRDGTQKWADAYDGPAGGVDAAIDLALAPDGQTLFVTGTSEGTRDDDVVTIAYGSSGTRLWVVRYEDSGNATADCIDASADSSQLFVTADVGSGDIATIAYSYNGEPLWSTSYSDVSTSVRDCAASADGGSLIATGYDNDVYEHLVTIASSVR